MDPSESRLYIGQLIDGKYQIQSFRGSGAFSGAFDALDVTTGGMYVAKLLSLSSSGNPVAVNEFSDEVSFLNLLSTCSNVITLHRSGAHLLPVHVAGSPGASVSVSVPFMILDRADADFAEVLIHRHRIPWKDRLVLYRDVVLGAHQMHSAHIVHRDIKGENVLIFSSLPQARISDLGRSRNARVAPRLPPQHYEWGRGDPRFAPPEYLWFLGTDEPMEHLRTDVYHLGSLLFEIATAQGITSIALGNPRAIMMRAQGMPSALREPTFRSELAMMMTRYELAYDVFQAELPALIRHEGLALLRQLTHPDPQARGLKRPFHRLPMYWDLQWLLRRVDILIKRLETESRTSRPSWRRRVRSGS